MRLLRAPAAPVPIYVAALGAGMLRAAGEVGTGVLFYMVGPRIMPELLSLIGKPVDSVARIVVIPSPDPVAAAGLARRLITTYALVPYYARVMARQGFGEEVAAIGRLWQAGDRARAPGQVSDEMVRELVLAGDEDAIRAGIEAYHRAGLGTPVLAVASPPGDEDRQSGLERVLTAAAG
jgi:alkanesulfonate monooxygenase SsuD/methylene tetrahydromethanopterin reductase-like flavin-dependent oxidoreductase (luciferase family)